MPAHLQNLTIAAKGMRPIPPNVFNLSLDKMLNAVTYMSMCEGYVGAFAFTSGISE